MTIDTGLNLFPGMNRFKSDTEMTVLRERSQILHDRFVNIGSAMSESAQTYYNNFVSHEAVSRLKQYLTESSRVIDHTVIYEVSRVNLPNSNNRMRHIISLDTNFIHEVSKGRIDPYDNVDIIDPEDSSILSAIYEGVLSDTDGINELEYTPLSDTSWGEMDGDVFITNHDHAFDYHDKERIRATWLNLRESIDDGDDPTLV